MRLERYREAMHRLRPDPRPSPDLPADPDAADLPEACTTWTAKR